MNNQNNVNVAKNLWVRPTVQRIAAGSAESGSLAVRDAGGGNQAS